MLHRRVRQHARQRKQVITARLLEHLQKGETDAVTALKEELDVLSDLESCYAPREWALRTIAPVLVPVVLLVLVWFVPESSPRLEVSLAAKRVVLDLDSGEESLKLGRLPPSSKIDVTGLESISSDTGELDSFAPELSHIRLRGPIVIDQLAIERAPDATARRLLIRRRPATTEVGLRGLKARIQINVGMAHAMVTRGNKVQSTTIARSALELVTQSGPSLVFDWNDIVELPPLAVSRLRFYETIYDYAGSEQSFSSVVGGKLILESVGREVMIPQSASVNLAELVGDTSIAIEKDVIRVAFHGTAGLIEVGGRDARPRWVEWLSRDRDIALLWSAIVFLLGLAWGGRGLLLEGLGKRR